MGVQTKNKQGENKRKGADEYYNKPPATRLRELTDNKGLPENERYTKRQIAELVSKKLGKNIKEQTVSAWCRGVSLPNSEQLLALSEVLNCSIEWLLGKSVFCVPSDVLEMFHLKARDLDEKRHNALLGFFDFAFMTNFPYILDNYVKAFRSKNISESDKSLGELIRTVETWKYIQADIINEQSKKGEK
jgi:transcriptional regulator with XRE-family HTH domain